MKGGWTLQRKLLFAKLARLREENAALHSEVALLRMRVRQDSLARSLNKSIREFEASVIAPSPLSEEDDPPRT